MRWLFIRGKTSLNNERGTIIVIMVFVVMLLAILFAGMVQLGIFLLARDQVQTAADAAALAAAGSGTHRFVQINVVTDRGVEKVCTTDEDGNTTCECVECGEARIEGIVGNEADLLDKGGWRKFCVPRCGGCDSGDCWYELVRRDIMYDTHSMGWGTSAENIAKVEKNLTDATRTIVSYISYDYRNTISRMVEGMSLAKIDYMLNNKQDWMNRWMATRGYYGSCPHSYVDVTIGAECREWYSIGEQQYRKINDKRDIARKMIDTIEEMRQYNSRKVPKIDSQYTGAAGRFFEANLPPNAEDAGIVKIKAYGYEERNSPYYPSIVVYATAKIKTLFPKLFPDDFMTTVCASGATSFRDAEDQKRGGNKFYDALTGGKWYRVPEDACWVDW